MKNRYAEVDSETGVVISVIFADYEFVSQIGGTWIGDLPYGVAPGWYYDGEIFSDPEGNPASEPEKGLCLTCNLHPVKWVDRFSDSERSWLKTQREANTNAGRRLNDLWTAVITSNVIDVSSENLDPFYDWLLSNGLPGGQARVDELRQPEPVTPGAIQ